MKIGTNKQIVKFVSYMSEDRVYTAFQYMVCWHRIGPWLQVEHVHLNLQRAIASF